MRFGFSAVLLCFGAVCPVLSCCTAVFCGFISFQKNYTLGYLQCATDANINYWLPFIASGPLVFKTNMTEEACSLVWSATAYLITQNSLLQTARCCQTLVRRLRVLLKYNLTRLTRGVERNNHSFTVFTELLLPQIRVKTAKR